MGGNNKQSGSMMDSAKVRGHSLSARNAQTLIFVPSSRIGQDGYGRQQQERRVDDGFGQGQCAFLSRPFIH
jgi:hypothetical protein